MKVFMAFKPNQHRSARVQTAFTKAITQAGHKPWGRTSDADAAIIYGLGPTHKDYYGEMRVRDKPVLCVDLGYWNRSYSLGDCAMYKVSPNYWHPQEAIRAIADPGPERRKALGLVVRPWQDNPRGHIVLAGMGQKSCVLYQYPDQSWDLAAVQEIRQNTDRQIYYKPKPSWRGCPPIAGTVYRCDEPIEETLNGAWALVTHHSNAAVDALLCGIPTFSWDGAAKYQSCSDLSLIESPKRPEDREVLLDKLVYFNWSVGEMASGDCWRFMWKNFIRG